MADVSIEMLILMFITVLLASLIGGFITVHFSQSSRRLASPNTTSQTRARTSTKNLPDSLTPSPNTVRNINNNNTNPQLSSLQNNTAAHNPLPPSHNPLSQPTILPLKNPNSNHQYPNTYGPSPPRPNTYGPSPIYGQNTTYPTQMHTQPNIFQYPNPMNNMNTLVNQTINNGNYLNVPAASLQTVPPTSTDALPNQQQLTPQQPISSITNSSSQPNRSRVTELLTDKYQPPKGNINNIRTTRMDNNVPISTTPSQSHQNTYGSSHTKGSN